MRHFGKRHYPISSSVEHWNWNTLPKRKPGSKTVITTFTAHLRASLQNSTWLYLNPLIKEAALHRSSFHRQNKEQVSIPVSQRVGHVKDCFSNICSFPFPSVFCLPRCNYYRRRESITQYVREPPRHSRRGTSAWDVQQLAMTSALSQSTHAGASHHKHHCSGGERSIECATREERGRREIQNWIIRFKNSHCYLHWCAFTV